MIDELRTRPDLLALLPPTITVISDTYQAWYHNTIFLFGTIVQPG